jgi:hypothetical protein
MAARISSASTPQTTIAYRSAEAPQFHDTGLAQVRTELTLSEGYVF